MKLLVIGARETANPLTLGRRMGLSFKTTEREDRKLAVVIDTELLTTAEWKKWYNLICCFLRAVKDGDELFIETQHDYPVGFDMVATDDDFKIELVSKSIGFIPPKFAGKEETRKDFA